MLIALKNNCVVAIQKNGSIDLTVEHDTIVDVADHHEFDMGWTYIAPPNNDANLTHFIPKDFVEDPSNPIKPVEVYAVDSAGNKYELSEEEKLAMNNGTWTRRQAA